MEMLLSKSCIHALQSSAYLAEQDENCYITIRELSDEPGNSFHFLIKVLPQLTKQNILKSYKGYSGGVKFPENAGEITFSDVVYSLDGGQAMTKCAPGLQDCCEPNPCLFNNHLAGFYGGDGRCVRSQFNYKGFFYFK